MKRATLRAVALAGVASLALAACGSGDTESEAEAAASPSVECTADGTLKFGTILPQTGSLSILGPPEFAGVDLAVQEINAAGGVLDKDVEKFEGDSGDTTTQIAVTTADEMLQRGVDAVIGAASSAVTLTFIDKVTSAGVLQMSPANTSPELTSYADNGLFFRTAPSDLFQGAVLAGVAADDGAQKPAVLALQDAYGEGLSGAFESNFTDAGGELAGDVVIYDPNAKSFEAEVGQIKASSPDAIVVIGFQETSKILQEMIKQGVGPDKVPLYLVDGNLSNSLGEGLPAGILAGTKGTLPGSEVSEEFRAEMLKVDPKLVDFSYGPEAYDAVNVIALGAVAAGSDCGPDIAAELVDVTSGGEVCTDFASCAALLEAGTDIDYEGQSGPISFDENGDPSLATMGVYEFGADNTYTRIDSVEGEVPAPAE